MFFLKDRSTLEKSGLFKGFTDCHSHILPGVDDGVRSLEESLSILAAYERLGVSSVWLTPHIMEDVPNTSERLECVFRNLRKAYEGPITLHLAAENMMDSLFNERMSSGHLMPVFGDMVLVETSYFNPPMDLSGLLKKLEARGFKPLLAHPERYIYMGEADYSSLYDSGIAFQLNLGSLTGIYGSESRLKAEMLLNRGYYFCAGTDLHSLLQLEKMCTAPVKRKYIESARQLTCGGK